MNTNFVDKPGNNFLLSILKNCSVPKLQVLHLRSILPDMWGYYCPQRTSCWVTRSTGQGLGSGSLGGGGHIFSFLWHFTFSQHYNSLEPSPGESQHIMLPLAFYWRGDVFVNCVVRLMKRGPLRTPEWPSFSVYCQHLKLWWLQNIKQTADLTDSFHCYIAQSFIHDARKYLKILVLRCDRLICLKCMCVCVLWIEARFL